MKRNSYCILMVLFILAACARPEAGPQAATATQEATVTSVPTHAIEPTLLLTKTLENEFIINPTIPNVALNENNNADEYSNILIEDFIKGDLLELETQYLESNNLFTEEVVTRNQLSTESHKYEELMFGSSVLVHNINFPLISEYKNPNARPIKIFSFYKFYDPNLLRKLGQDEETIAWGEKQSGLWIVAWAYKNPDETISIGHTLINIAIYKEIERRAQENIGGNLKFLPSYKISEIQLSEDEHRNSLNPWFLTDKLHKLYPELNPEPEIAQWIESGQMNPTLQKKLFTLQTVIVSW